MFSQKFTHVRRHSAIPFSSPPLPHTCHLLAKRSYSLDAVLRRVLLSCGKHMALNYLFPRGSASKRTKGYISWHRISCLALVLVELTVLFGAKAGWKPVKCGLRDLWHGTSAEVLYAPGMALPLSKGSLLCLKSSDFPTEESLSVWTVSFTKPQRVPSKPSGDSFCAPLFCGEGRSCGGGCWRSSFYQPPVSIGVEVNRDSDNQLSLGQVDCLHSSLCIAVRGHCSPQPPVRRAAPISTIS